MAESPLDGSGIQTFERERRPGIVAQQALHAGVIVGAANCGVERELDVLPGQHLAHVVGLENRLRSFLRQAWGLDLCEVAVRVVSGKAQRGGMVIPFQRVVTPPGSTSV